MWRYSWLLFIDVWRCSWLLFMDVWRYSWLLFMDVGSNADVCFQTVEKCFKSHHRFCSNPSHDQWNVVISYFCGHDKVCRWVRLRVREAMNRARSAGG